MIYTRESVMALIEEKEKLEQTLKELWDVLKSNNVGMTEPVIDSEGYPRSDIDVYQVRHARHQIKCLQNDHTALLRHIEEGLAVVLSPSNVEAMDPNGVSVSPPTPSREPFARVDYIALGSPASIAGVEEKDLVTQFGSITSDNFRSMANLSQVVQHSVNSPIQVIVIRNEQSITLSLTPRQWSGRGLLGCNIVPIEKLDR
ncbi:26S proteasome non-ATPase regulatory subunit 9 isoform X1 [Procambarus clarkii]|uniref:26S proteasome non-ATPase regulatory subunit 9 isoform X1 n=2 Tax=Procambarus clarkii TaxID=6728 RepID=UPI001E677AC1|nr:26S proteasome non-ATPase regulatory subunit 9-like isoform X1 [Procambarus clarkii]XP_045612883.1 26S proteasome non-ATPase regulatory subunit 9-like isoform X1 [Procambarus clarkii]XP_045612884.1 26S proteasome non-ATPase regulatory subunit 9-like isoform X1 [Procambarus clarkii]XP_045612885.1 26S proteasome non-ATPase regulatory subunit 9-like isoform X1 [Procambarus clarkii]XP_045612886.1 26S proteasome non-ATPase regulatory subunit 9-like isoform X1 [Procambarus clarkii]XP_045612888.1 